MSTIAPVLPDSPSIDRIRHEVKLRTTEVRSVERVTPGMLRITVSGEELANFLTASFDDHVKIIVPGVLGYERRDYTPRRFDRNRCILTLDFAVHDAGPATRWALAAQPGDHLVIAGPKGSTVVSSDVRRWLLIGDETALPAIGRRIEEASAGETLTSVVAVDTPANEQRFDTAADLTALWAHRSASECGNASALLTRVAALQWAPDTFIRVAAEASVARAVRDYVLDQRDHRRGWTKASGYWIVGQSDGSERIR